MPWYLSTGPCHELSFLTLTLKSHNSRSLSRSYQNIFICLTWHPMQQTTCEMQLTPGFYMLNWILNVTKLTKNNKRITLKEPVPRSLWTFATRAGSSTQQIITPNSEPKSQAEKLYIIWIVIKVVLPRWVFKRDDTIGWILKRRFNLSA